MIIYIKTELVLPSACRRKAQFSGVQSTTTTVLRNGNRLTTGGGCNREANLSQLTEVNRRVLDSADNGRRRLADIHDHCVARTPSRCQRFVKRSTAGIGGLHDEYIACRIEIVRQEANLTGQGIDRTFTRNQAEGDLVAVNVAGAEHVETDTVKVAHSGVSNILIDYQLRTGIHLYLYREAVLDTAAALILGPESKGVDRVHRPGEETMLIGQRARAICNQRRCPVLKQIKIDITRAARNVDIETDEVLGTEQVVVVTGKTDVQCARVAETNFRDNVLEILIAANREILPRYDIDVWVGSLEDFGVIESIPVKCRLGVPDVIEKRQAQIDAEHVSVAGSELPDIADAGAGGKKLGAIPDESAAGYQPRGEV